MSFNPLEQPGIPVDEQLRSWSELNVQPYDAESVDPYTRCRVILMNGIEFESILFSHQFARHTESPRSSRQLALSRRCDQQQQTAVSWLLPGDQSTLEVHPRLRAGGGRPDRVVGPQRAGSLCEAGARVRAARRLRPPLPLRQPLRDARGEEGRADRRQPHRGHARAARRSRSTATRSTTSAPRRGATRRTPRPSCNALTIVGRRAGRHELLHDTSANRTWSRSPEACTRRSR